MASSSSALIPWQNQDGHCTVALRSDRQVAMFDMNLGPGRLLNEAYSASGRWLEKGLGLTGHKLGLGPSAVSRRIEKVFGDNTLTRQSKLDSIYDSFQDGTNVQRDRALIKECQKLLEYALPSQTPVTQTQTAKQIITLTTRYPGLRRLFLQSPDIGTVADSPDAICEIWQNTDHNYDTESHFLLNFAANCLAGIEPNIELESIRPSELGHTSERIPGVVERLIARHCDSEEGSRFPRLIAIRYIATTLKLPAFWSENYQIQKITMDVLCKQTLLFIEDIDPESVNAGEFESALFDPDGIDALAEAIMEGAERWIREQPRISESGPPYWLASFVKLIKRLRGLILPNLLPMAFQRAKRDWEALLRVVKHELPMSSLDQFEDVYTFITGCSGILPSLMKLFDIAGELPNDDIKGFSSLEANKVEDSLKSPSPLSPIKHNIVIFGESGSGKSSLINMIVGQDVAKVSNSPVGCTFENEWYETSIDGIPYLVHDTVGINEGGEFRFPHWKAIQGLYTLIRRLDGVSLLIFCVRGRISGNARANWLFFFDVICDKKVPVVVVSTCWEQEEDLEVAEAQLWDSLKKYSMDPKAVACVVSIWGRNNEYEEGYKLSQQRLRNLIMRCCMQEPWSKDKDEWFSKLYRKAYDRKLGIFAKSRLQFFDGIRLPLQEFKKNGNLKEIDIDQLTKVLLQAEKKIMKSRF